MSTVTVMPLTPAAAAQLVNCGQCRQRPGKPCWPWGSHLARYQRANRRGLLSDDALAAVVAGREVIAGHEIVRGRCAVAGVRSPAADSVRLRYLVAGDVVLGHRGRVLRVLWLLARVHRASLAVRVEG